MSGFPVDVERRYDGRSGLWGVVEWWEFLPMSHFLRAGVVSGGNEDAGKRL